MNSRTIAFAALCALATGAAAAEPVPVSVSRLGDLLVDRELRAPATVIAANRAVITSEVTALIESVGADVGAGVNRDDLLVRLDDDNARLALARARATLEALDAQIVQARRRLARAEELLEKSFVSDDELVERQTSLAVLQADRAGQLVAIEEAELALARTRIRAPFAGTVVERQAQVGSFAMPGTPLLTLVQTDGRELDVELDPRYAADIPRIDSFRFISQDLEWKVVPARVSEVIEPATRKQRGRFRFVEQAAPIGASGELVWSDASGVVPVPLIVKRGETFGVFVANDSRARFVAIPQAQEGRPAAVDLPDDALVVSRGQARLQDGDELKITRE